MKKKLILGAIYGYGWRDIASFVQTAHGNIPNCEIVLLYSHIKDEDLLEIGRHNVVLCEMPYREKAGLLNSWQRFWPFLCFIRFMPMQMAKNIQNWLLPFAWSRYFGYYDYLKKHRQMYSHCLLTDVRDVVFQSDPFESVYASGLRVYLEEGNSPLKTCDMNSQWIKEILPVKVSDKILDKEISCCGTVLGEISSIVDYLTFFVRYSLRVRSITHGGDTALHDWIVYATPQLEKQIIENGKEAVVTINSRFLANANIDDDLIIRNLNGAVPVVHQYDRIVELKQKYSQ